MPMEMTFMVKLLLFGCMALPLASEDLQALKDIYAFPSYQTSLLWIEQYCHKSHFQSKIVTGNKMPDRSILGQSLSNLALYRVVHPKCPRILSHTRAFLFNYNLTIATFSLKAIIQAEQLLGLRMNFVKLHVRSHIGQAILTNEPCFRIEIKLMVE